LTQAAFNHAGEIWSAAADRTVIDLVRTSCRSDPSRTAIVFEDGVEISRASLLDHAERFAGYLRDTIKPTGRVAVMIGNRAEFMVAWLAIVAVRGTMVSVDPAAGSHDLRHVLNDSESVLLVADVKFREIAVAAMADCPKLEGLVFVDGDEPDGLASYSDGHLPMVFAQSMAIRTDITNIYYTSGTTGPPKGCLCDHEWWLRTVDLILRIQNWTAEDRVLCCLQFFYSDPSSLLLASLKSGGVMVTMRRFSASRFWDVVREHRVTILLGIGAIPVLLLRAPPTHLDRQHQVKRAYQLAIPPDLHQELVSRFGFPWIESYGITEGNMVAGMPIDRVAAMVGSGSMGIPYPEVATRIVDANGSQVPSGVTGELLVKGPGMMRGYLNRPAPNQDAIAPDGWLATGDLVQADEDGFLYFQGRKKDVIRRSGQNISPAEVENVIRKHPGIADVAVLGVSDAVRGEELKAYVVLKDGETEQSVPPTQIVSLCSRELAAYKVPRFIAYWSRPFPRTPSMRVQKDILRAAGGGSSVWDREKTVPGGVSVTDENHAT